MGMKSFDGKCKRNNIKLKKGGNNIKPIIKDSIFELRKLNYSYACIGEQGEPHTPRRLAMIFRRQQPQGLPFASVFVCDCLMSDGIIRSDPHGGETMAPLYFDDNSEQVGVVYERSGKPDRYPQFVSENMIPNGMSFSNTASINYVSPLFILNDENGRKANFDEAKIEQLFSEVEQPEGDFRKVYSEDIFNYIYASLSSPSYREKYKEFLKTDFPRVPRPKNWADFWRLSELGGKLVKLHLMQGDIKSATRYPEAGDNVVTKYQFDDGKVWINDAQYFENVSELAWSFYIGGYQPAQKWLKDRKGKALSFDDIEHYGKIISVLEETDKIMKEIG